MESMRQPVSARPTPRNGSRPETSGLRKRRKRLSGPERRERLIKAAQKLFSIHGFRGATTRQLARAAGITDAVIFRHFPSKAALYAACLEERDLVLWSGEWIEELEGRLRVADDEGFIRLYFKRVIEAADLNPYYARLLLYAALEPHPVHRRAHVANTLQLKEVITKFVVAGQESGRFRSGSVALLVQALLALPVYHNLENHLFKQPWRMCSTSEMLEVGVQMVLAALCAPRDDRPSPIVRLTDGRPEEMDLAQASS